MSEEIPIYILNAIEKKEELLIEFQKIVLRNFKNFAQQEIKTVWSFADDEAKNCYEILLEKSDLACSEWFRKQKNKTSDNERNGGGDE